MKVLVYAGLMGLLLLGGCPADDTSTTDTSTTDTNTTADVVNEDTAPTPIEVTNNVTINDFVSLAPIEGVTVCTNDETVDCVTTDAEGKASFTVSVVPGQLVQLRADKEGYFPFLAEGLINDDAVSGALDTAWVMAGSDILDTLVGTLETEIDETKGHITISALGALAEDGTRPSIEGATFSIDANAVAGPKYFNPIAQIASGIFGDDAAGTTATGLASFFNVDVGAVNITANAGDLVCTPGLSGLPSDSGSVTATVEAGRATYVAVVCVPKE
jgi:hypothetical protein